MAKFSFVLSNDLLKEYIAFKHGEKHNKNTIQKLLPFCTEQFLFSIKQCEELGINLQGPLENLIRRNSKGCHNIEQLVPKTIYKAILYKSDGDEANVYKTKGYPYIDIESGIISPSITGTVVDNTSRETAKKHLQALCAKTKSIFIYDKYFNAEDNYDLLLEILPDAPLIIEYIENQSDQKHIDRLSDLRPEWQWKSHNARRFSDPVHHDRYLILDRKTEIIISSAFDRLSGKGNCDLTYVINNTVKNWDELLELD